MDETILLWINHHYNAFGDAVMPLLTHRFMWIPMYVALAYAICRTLGWRRGLLVIAAIALTTVLADQVSSHVIRPWAQRLRPSNLDNPLSQYIHIVGGYRGAPYGMPSSHAANTVGLLTTLVLLFRNRMLCCVMASWMLLQVYSRMYLGVHYPTDIIVGSVVGCASAYIIYKVGQMLCRGRIDGSPFDSRSLLKHEWLPEAVFAATLIVIAVIGWLS